MLYGTTMHTIAKVIKGRYVRVSASLVPKSLHLPVQKKGAARSLTLISLRKPLILPSKSKSNLALKSKLNLASKLKTTLPSKSKSKTTLLSKSKLNLASKTKRDTATATKSGVYVLELKGGFVYVGKSADISGRVKDHVCGVGAKFTKKYRPTGKLLPRLGKLVGEGDGPERDETLRQMLRRGASKVRGWKYCKTKHSPWDVKDIESNIRELLDLCRRCGRKGHFATFCKFRTDRLGKPCRSGRRKG